MPASILASPLRRSSSSTRAVAAAPASPRPKLGRHLTSCSGSPRASSGGSTSTFACCGTSSCSARTASRGRAWLATAPPELRLLFRPPHLASHTTAASAERAGGNSPILLDPYMDGEIRVQGERDGDGR
nr:unnamed protein product [Digitaria exilis]